VQTHVYEIRFDKTQFNDKFRRIKIHRIYDFIYSMSRNIVSLRSGFVFLKIHFQHGLYFMMSCKP